MPTTHAWKEHEKKTAVRLSSCLCYLGCVSNDVMIKSDMLCSTYTRNKQTAPLENMEKKEVAAYCLSFCFCSTAVKHLAEHPEVCNFPELLRVAWHRQLKGRHMLQNEQYRCTQG